jgi:hypothetical protein
MILRVLMGTVNTDVKKTIVKITKFLEEKCGCEVDVDDSKHYKITFSGVGRMAGVVILAKTPSTPKWLKYLKTDLRREMLRVGFNIDETKNMKSAISFFVGTDENQQKELENLFLFCKRRTKLTDEQIRDLCVDRRERFTIKGLEEKYGVSKSTIYRYLNEYDSSNRTEH